MFGGAAKLERDEVVEARFEPSNKASGSGLVN
jgi:hypothetical protein